MKQILNKIAVLILLGMAAASCKKDENKVYFEGGVAPVISANTTTGVVLKAADADKEVLKLTWTNPSYKFNTGVSSQNATYTLEMDTAGANFKSSLKKTYAIVSDVNKTFTGSELNGILVNTMQLPVNVPHALQVRVLSSINKAPATQLVSNVINLTVTPYDQPITLTYLYVPGAYQNWSPSTAPQLGSTDTKNFEGYVYITQDNSEFKFTSQADWNGTNYGDGGAGKISATGGNLKFPGAAAYYLVKVNVPNLTWQATKTDWAVIGSATPGGWDADTQMTFNTTTQKLEIASLPLTVGELKFRANKSWDVNLGKEGTGTKLNYNGANLNVTAAGNYKIVLDLSHPHEFTYTLTKL